MTYSPKPVEWNIGYQDGLSATPKRYSGIKGNGDSDNSAAFYAYSEGYDLGTSQRNIEASRTPEELAEREKNEAFYGGDQWATKKLLDTLAERGSRYGVFVDNAVIAQSLKRVIRTGKSWQSSSEDVKEAVDFILSKLSRVVSGDPEYADNWHDIAGFAKLVEDRINGKAQ